jgi:hypothetical protein
VSRKVSRLYHFLSLTILIISFTPEIQNWVTKDSEVLMDNEHSIFHSWLSSLLRKYAESPERRGSLFQDPRCRNCESRAGAMPRLTDCPFPGKQTIPVPGWVRCLTWLWASLLRHKGEKGNEARVVSEIALHTVDLEVIPVYPHPPQKITSRARKWAPLVCRTLAAWKFLECLNSDDTYHILGAKIEENIAWQEVGMSLFLSHF